MAALGPEDLLIFRVPLIISLNCLLELCYRFEIGFKEEAQKYHEKIQDLIGQFNFRVLFSVLQVWIVRSIKECFQVGKGIKPSDPQTALKWLHETLELLARAIDLNTLSLDIQREADQYTHT